MPIKILMPALSPTMTEGNLARWLKSEGDQIKAGDVIAEIETDKATMEVEAVDEGTLAKVLVQGGTENVKVNSLIALILEEGESKEALDNFAIGNLTRDKVEKLEVVSAKGNNIPVSADTSKSLNSGSRIIASPLAKRIAENNKLDLKNISGSGPHGRIIKIDVENLLNSKETIPASVTRSQDEYRLAPNSNVRKIIAKRLLESKITVPHFYLSIECNIDKLLQARSDINNLIEGENKISVNDFVILASAKALYEVPEANSSWTDEAIKYYNNVDISVAVAIEGGLITPVIRGANLKSLTNISTEMKSLAKRARENKLMPEEFQGGSFSISNLGMYGIKKFNAIINPPQSCILAVGESSKRPVVINNQIIIGTIMDISLSCDHRVVDGAVGAKFLKSFKKFIENPILLVV